MYTVLFLFQRNSLFVSLSGYIGTRTDMIFIIVDLLLFGRRDITIWLDTCKKTTEIYLNALSIGYRLRNCEKDLHDRRPATAGSWEPKYYNKMYTLPVIYFFYIYTILNIFNVSSRRKHNNNNNNNNHNNSVTSNNSISFKWRISGKLVLFFIIIMV